MTSSAPEPARPRRFDGALRKGDRRREQLLDAAEQLLGTMPPSELTIDQVARGAGVSRSSLYFYFTGKWEIVDQLIERASQEMFERTQAIDAEAPFEQWMPQMVEVAVAGWRAHRAVFLAATERSAHADEETDHWRSIMGGFVAVIAEHLEREADLAAAVAPLGGATRAAELLCWMVERNLYMHFSAEQRQGTQALVDALGVAVLRVVGATRPR